MWGPGAGAHSQGVRDGQVCDTRTQGRDPGMVPSEVPFPVSSPSLNPEAIGPGDLDLRSAFRRT